MIRFHNKIASIDILKESIIIAILVITSYNSALCQNNTIVDASGKGPNIAFRSISHDFGTLNYGEEAVHFFVFTNDGESPLVILNVRTACGCIVHSWPKNPLASRIRDSIRVEYNTKIKGTFSKTITVQSNAINSPVDLKITGNVSGKKK